MGEAMISQLTAEAGTSSRLVRKMVAAFYDFNFTPT